MTSIGPLPLMSFKGLLPATNLTESSSPSSEPPRPHSGRPRARTPVPKEMQQVFFRYFSARWQPHKQPPKVDDGQPACECVIVREDELVGTLNRLIGL